jgi:uncharacterized membrane protein
MKWLSAIASFSLMVMLTVSSSGCKKGEQKSVEGPKGEKLTLTAPPDTDIKVGNTAKVTVKIAREKFTDPVDIEITDLPAGVTADPAKTTIGKDNTSADITLKAANDAKADSKEAKVKASGGSLSQEANFKVTVKKKE